MEYAYEDMVVTSYTTYIVTYVGMWLICAMYYLTYFIHVTHNRNQLTFHELKDIQSDTSHQCENPAVLKP